MKRNILIIGILLVVTHVARANGIEGNPDRFMSLGLDVTGARSPHAVIQSIAPATPPVSNVDTGIVTDRTITADFRIPMYSWLTLNVHGGSWQQTNFAATSNGYTIGGGFRVYFTTDSGN